eukprot:RCo032085
MVLVKVHPVVVLTPSLAPPTGVLAVLAHTPMPTADGSSKFSLVIIPFVRLRPVGHSQKLGSACFRTREKGIITRENFEDPSAVGMGVWASTASTPVGGARLGVSTT